MDGAATAGKQPRMCECPGAGADATDLGACRGLLLQPAYAVLRVIALRVDATADKYAIELIVHFRASVRSYRQPIAGFYPFPVVGKKAPLIEGLTCGDIGGAVGFDSRAECQQGKLRRKQKCDSFWWGAESHGAFRLRGVECTTKPPDVELRCRFLRYWLAMIPARIR